MGDKAISPAVVSHKPLHDHPDFNAYREANDLIIDGLRAELKASRQREAKLASYVESFHGLYKKRWGKPGETDALFCKAFEELIVELPETGRDSSYTAVLLYPDYATGDHGADIYVDAVSAVTPEEAASKVATMASEANDGDISADDFRPILVLAGDVDVELDATNFEELADA